jgi:hypothetical protein
MIVERFRPEHLAQLELQPAQDAARNLKTDPEYLEAVSAGVAVTVRDTEILGCGGIVEFDEGSVLWTLLSPHAGRFMVGIVRAARRLVEVAPRPVYATAACDFPQGCRLLELLGFNRLPDPVTGISTDGKAHFVYERTA